MEQSLLSVTLSSYFPWELPLPILLLLLEDEKCPFPKWLVQVWLVGLQIFCFLLILRFRDWLTDDPKSISTYVSLQWTWASLPWNANSRKEQMGWKGMILALQHPSPFCNHCPLTDLPGRQQFASKGIAFFKDRKKKKIRKWSVCFCFWKPLI